MGERRAPPELHAPGRVSPVSLPTFEEFFEREHERLLGALYIVTRNRPDAEELTQEAFLKLWERWDDVRRLENPTGYLYRTAMNGFRMRYRRAVVAARKLVGLSQRHDELDTVEIREEIRSALAGLSPRQRAAVVMTDLLEFSSAEAARVMGIKDSTVRALSTQARSALRTAMEAPRE